MDEVKNSMLLINIASKFDFNHFEFDSYVNVWFKCLYLAFVLFLFAARYTLSDAGVLQFEVRLTSYDRQQKKLPNRNAIYTSCVLITVYGISEADADAELNVGIHTACTFGQNRTLRLLLTDILRPSMHNTQFLLLSVNCSTSRSASTPVAA